MTKEQSIIYMNLLASFLDIVGEFSLPFQEIHALIGFEAVRDEVYGELNSCSELGAQTLFDMLSKEIAILKTESAQRKVLIAYHICIWMDQMLTYERQAKNKFSIYELIPLSQYSFIEVYAMNNNYAEVGIWINPRLPIYKSVSLNNDGTEREKAASSRDAFYGMNGELKNIFYFSWEDNQYKIRNIVLPYENIEKNIEGNLRVGFIPISDKRDLLEIDNKSVKCGDYNFNKMYIKHLNHEDVIVHRYRKGLELACSNNADIVFAPEMLGCEQMEHRTHGGTYNPFVYSIYGEAIINGKKPPLLTVMPSYWKNGINQATIIYRDGSILGSQQKYSPFVDFKACSEEGIVRVCEKEIILVHIYGVHRLAILICAEFIDNFDSDFICGKLGTTLILVPSYSRGENDFINAMGTLFPYGTSVVWGDCCGAVDYIPRAIGGCSLIGAGQVYKMSSVCNCDYACDLNDGCIFIADLPLKAVFSKEGDVLQKPIEHIINQKEDE